MQRWFLSGDRAEDYEYGIDPKLKYQGKNCIYLRPRVPEPRDFASVMQMIEATPYRNKRMRLSGALKTVGIEGWAGLWMRVDGVDTHLLDNMEDRPIQGTTEWRTHEVVLDVPEQGLPMTRTVRPARTPRPAGPHRPHCRSAPRLRAPHHRPPPVSRLET